MPNIKLASHTPASGAPDLAYLVDPRSVAIIGASDRSGSLGRRSVENLLDHSDFRGTTYLISKSTPEIHGLKTFPSVRDVPAAPDLAMLVVPAAATLASLRECAERGVKFAIVFTSGFGEMGEEGRAAEAEMAKIAAESGMRIYGPNCPGLCNLNKRLGFMFSPSFKVDQLPGPIGLATQGGGIGRCFIQGLERGIGVGLWASTGNEVDLCVSDFIRYMADADDIKVIATAMEGIKDGGKFSEAALYAAEKGKPVIALKVGRSDYGAKAVASHTGSISGAAEVTSAVFRQVGVVEVDDIDELLDTAALFARKRPTGKEKIAVYGFSGGACAMSADAVGGGNLELAAFSAATRSRLAEILPAYAAIDNPVDATSDVLSNSTISYESLKATAEDPSVGLIFFPFPCDYAELTDAIAHDIVRVQSEVDVPIVATWMSDRLGLGYHTLVKGGIVPNRSVQRATVAMRRWIDRGLWEQSFRAGWRPMGATAGSPEKSISYSEGAAKCILAAAGIAVLASGLAQSADEAVKIGDRVGYPVVAKIASSKITHKSDIGGVVVGLRDAASVRDAYANILAAGRRVAPDAIDGVLIEKMAGAGGFEVLVGVTRDPIFGPFLTFGLGGIYVELFKDVSRRLLPLTRELAFEMIAEPKVSLLLKGLRGRAPADIDALASLLVAVSDFVVQQGGNVVELELNPVWVGVKGQGAMALDAVLVTAQPVGDGS
jgi:acetate---CoA ligase (ADP-forming)